MSLPLLTAADLRRIGTQSQAADGGVRCPACGGLDCPGWEALPGGFDADVLEAVGTLRDPDLYEPTYEEHHPGGTRTWDAAAPIAPRSHPYNRSEVWRCRSCQRAFLRWTEVGGYYREDRIRALDPALVVDA